MVVRAAPAPTEALASFRLAFISLENVVRTIPADNSVCGNTCTGPRSAVMTLTHASSRCRRVSHARRRTCAFAALATRTARVESPPFCQKAMRSSDQKGGALSWSEPQMGPLMPWR